MPNLSFILSPLYQKTFEYSQYVDTYIDPTAANTYGKRYVFGELESTDFISKHCDLNWTFHTKVKFAVICSALISAGDYNNYKELAQPSSYDFVVFGTNGSTFDSETNTADPDGDGPAQPIEIDNPDFNVRSLAR